MSQLLAHVATTAYQLPYTLPTDLGSRCNLLNYDSTHTMILDTSNIRVKFGLRSLRLVDRHTR